MAAPKATFFVFSFIFSPLHLFTTNVTQALPLETIKGEARDTSQEEKFHNDQLTHTPHTQIPRRDLGFAPSLESL
jgi:hypothetical protein